MYEKLCGYIKKYDLEIVECGWIDFWHDNEIKRQTDFAVGCYKDNEFEEKIGKKLIYNDKFFLQLLKLNLFILPMNIFIIIE